MLRSKKNLDLRQFMLAGILALSSSTAWSDSNELETIQSATPISARIIGGTTAQLGELPYQVAIFYDQNNVYDSQYCGGALIDPSWVLTAAHCFSSDLPPTYVGVGFTNLNITSVGEVKRYRNWYIHPEFDPATFDNDIALIELESPIDVAGCGSNCSTISYITGSNESSIATLGSSAVISGWGSTAAGLSPEPVFPITLQRATVDLVDCLASPSQLSSIRITDNMICAGTDDYDRDSCQGDSGGPLVVDDRVGISYVVGITSFGIGCAVENNPGVYTRVANYTNWISDVMSGSGCCASNNSGNNTSSNDGGSTSNTPLFVSDGGGGGFPISFIVALIGLSVFRLTAHNPSFGKR